MVLRISADAVESVRKLIDDACGNEVRLPCASAVVVCKGTKVPALMLSSETNERPGVYHDKVHWLASRTKLVTGIACMQLVEQARLRLDDSDQVEQLCPELAAVKVLQEDSSLVDKRSRITLRMLLTHTAGFGYSFLNEELRTYCRQNFPGQPVYDEFSGRAVDFQQPLVNHPGERFEYGINIDWASILVERVTGLTLSDYMQRFIFAPLNIKNVSMFPSLRMKEQLIGMWERHPTGRLSRREYPLNRPLCNGSPSDTFHSGGAGLFGSIREFTGILATLLNDGTSLQTGKTVLSPSTMKEMFTNQLPHDRNFARQYMPAVKADLVYPSEELYPLCPASSPQGWGHTFMISSGLTGRSGTTAHWSGISNVFWWCDRETGVADVVASQVLPFPDPDTVKLWADVEAKVYEGLR
ncbi:beta-lactamase/transpeptidase-like protein [Aspergillus floccosus]